MRETLHLWFADPEDLIDEGLEEACAKLLNEEETARWKAFRFERRRREYLATRALQRTALSALHAVAPADWQFEFNAHGKPAVQPECGLQFNLSNSPGLVVCLVSHGVEVGVDVEPYSRAKQVLEVARRVFSARELEELESLDGDARLDRAVSLWTLKEAYIKARGMGLALPLEKISFLFDDDRAIRLEVDEGVDNDAGHWSFCLLEQAGHRIALMAALRNVPELEAFEAQPLLGQGRQLKVSGQRWFPLR